MASLSLRLSDDEHQALKAYAAHLKDPKTYTREEVQQRLGISLFGDRIGEVHYLLFFL